MTTWKIANMDRHITDGIVYTVYWTASLQSEDYSASSYGSIGLQAPEDNVIPYEELTEEIVVGWLKNVLNAEEIESGLQAQIDLQKQPVSVSGLPWNEISVGAGTT
jgi:hypothetical protein